jgi:ferredoxin
MKENQETEQRPSERPDRIPDDEITRRELLQKLSPLGKVTLEPSRCTGCGLCAAECPTGALVVSAGDEADSFRLVFRHGICTACGQCAAICPESGLVVERILEPDRVGSRSVLFEDRLARCSECGSPIGPKSMIARMQARVKAAGKVYPFQFELCPACKVRARFGQRRV